LYEPPFVLDDSRSPLPEDYVAQLNTAIAEGKRGDAVELFMTKAINLPAEYLEGMKSDPSWAGMEAIAHTIAYDGTIMGNTMSGNPLESEVVKRWTSATMPTLVMSGGNSEPFFHDAAQALADLLPNGHLQTLKGQDHAIAPDVLAPVLEAFFAD
jgi:pimeloyl-ACP methyl ester carboxylesterase